MRRVNMRGITAGALVLAGIAALSGCASSKTSEGRAAQLRSDLTPELAAMAERDVDIKNQEALTLDENGRMLREDWQRFWLMERPSHLSPYPVAR